MRRRKFLFALAFLALAATATFATTVIQVSLSQAVAWSDRIVEGRVLSVTGFRDAKGRIGSRVAIQVSETFKGSASGVHEISIPVGSFEGRGVMVPGFPEFRVGEDTIVLLAPPNAMGVCSPVGLAQGKYRVTFDPKDGRKLVRRESTQGLTLLQPNGEEAAREAASPVFDHAEFVKTLRALVKEQREREGQGR